MQWIQIIIFLLTINGLFTLFSVRFNDFLHVLARTQKSTLQDDVDVLLGKPAKGFFNRETLESTANPYAIQTPIIDNPIINFSTLPSLLSQSGLLFPQDVFGIDKNGAGTPTIMNYSLSVQQSVGYGTIVDVGYVGSLGRRLQWRRNINPVPLGATFAPFSVDPTVAGGRPQPSFLGPITGFNNIGINEWASSSNYHSLQVTANRRFARSLEFGLAWTWSKAMGYNDGDTNEVSTLVSPRVWKRCRGEGGAE